MDCQEALGAQASGRHDSQPSMIRSLPYTSPSDESSPRVFPPSWFLVIISCSSPIWNAHCSFLYLTISPLVQKPAPLSHPVEVSYPALVLAKIPSELLNTSWTEKLLLQSFTHLACATDWNGHNRMCFSYLVHQFLIRLFSIRLLEWKTRTWAQGRKNLRWGSQWWEDFENTITGRWEEQCGAWS